MSGMSEGSSQPSSFSGQGTIAAAGAPMAPPPPPPIRPVYEPTDTLTAPRRPQYEPTDTLATPTATKSIIGYERPENFIAPIKAASVRTNNPAAAWPSPLAKEFGSTGEQKLTRGNKIAQFPTPIHGAAYNMALLGQKYVGQTISQVQKTWSGGDRSGLPGWPGTTVITPAMASDPNFMIPFMKDMANAEASKGATVMSDQQWKQAFYLYQQH